MYRGMNNNPKRHETMLKALDTMQTTQAVPLTLETLDNIRMRFDNLPKPPIFKNVYCCKNVFDKITAQTQTAYHLPYSHMYTGIDIFIDEDIADGEYMICTAEEYEIWKSLMSHPYIDKDKIWAVVQMIVEQRRTALDPYNTLLSTFSNPDFGKPLSRVEIETLDIFKI